MLVWSTQVPEVLSFSFNATLGTAIGAAATAGPGPGGPRESVSSPLFSAGERRSQAPWAGTGSLPLSMQEAYTPSQVQLLCAAEVRIDIACPIAFIEAVHNKHFMKSRLGSATCTGQVQWHSCHPTDIGQQIYGRLSLHQHGKDSLKQVGL